MNNLDRSLKFSLVSLHDFENSNLAARTLETLLSGPQFSVPTSYGEYEPLEGRIDPKQLGQVIDIWMGHGKNSSGYRCGLLQLGLGQHGGYLVDWTKGVDSYGHPTRFHHFSGWIPFSRLSGQEDLASYLSFIERLVQLIDPVYAFVANSATAQQVYTPLEKRLPDIQWGNYFGNPYIEMFGRRLLLESPFYKIRETSSGHIYAQLTESVLNPKLSSDKRAAVREWLGEDCFMTGSKMPHEYENGRAPKFSWPEWASGEAVKVKPPQRSRQ